MERLSMLVSDLDGTLLGDAKAVKEFAAWRRRTRRWMRVVYSSGRFLRSVRESIKAFGLPAPDGIVCGVGTEVYDFRDGGEPCEWPGETHGWDAQVVQAICLADSRLRLQPEEFRSRYKVSFYAADLVAEDLNRLLASLRDAGQRVSLVYSSQRDLDVLPAGVDKGSAISILALRWKIRPNDVIVAGDSGNDLAMFQAGFSGIIVGNALPELRRYRGRNAYHAARHHAAGVLEGLQHWSAKNGTRGLDPVN